MSIKTEDGLLEEVKKLENEIKTLNEELRCVGNEEKLENFKLSALQVKRDELTRDIEFYRNCAMETRKKLANKLHIHSQFAMADEYYKSVLQSYKENYAHVDPKENYSDNEKQKIQLQSTDLQKQIDDLQAKISLNDSSIKNMLETLGISVEK